VSREARSARICVFGLNAECPLAALHLLGQRDKPGFLVAAKALAAISERRLGSLVFHIAYLLGFPFDSAGLASPLSLSRAGSPPEQGHATYHKSLVRISVGCVRAIEKVSDGEQTRPDHRTAGNPTQRSLPHCGRRASPRVGTVTPASFLTSVQPDRAGCTLL